LNFRTTPFQPGLKFAESQSQSVLPSFPMNFEGKLRK
jgi:hypothetical protein